MTLYVRHRRLKDLTYVGAQRIAALIAKDAFADYSTAVKYQRKIGIVDDGTKKMLYRKYFGSRIVRSALGIFDGIDDEYFYRVAERDMRHFGGRGKHEARTARVGGR